MGNSEAVPLLRFATQKKERLYEADPRVALAFSGRALAPLPHPPRASTKTKTCLSKGWPDLALLTKDVEPCRIKQKGPNNAPVDQRPANSYPQYSLDPFCQCQRLRRKTTQKQVRFHLSIYSSKSYNYFNV